ncbi:hypothetical protein GCK72_014335 [Caenorhabditis remanei]|uniref:RING-type domain-containing protein n=1 Tax=Caenorhabditis remanei TaxID=31234 RepID=A0A6A5GR05_CAERE|nr:hypothetical protein GCK72_014335 [Caenorhabditis remanei]KAF1757878.1 hypothetical protein GCK72_014335 [Caenorhabditis remanei]
MEQFLLCFQCGKLYDEDEGRSPVKGECSHSICLLCYSMLTSSSDCPVCDEELTLKEPTLYEPTLNKSILKDANCLKLKMGEDNFSSIVENKRENLLRNTCSECSKENVKLRICVDCNKESGILMKKLEDRDWIVQYFPEHFTNIPSICSNCVFSKHEEHKTVNLQQIVNLKEVIACECYLKFSRRDHTRAGLYERRLRTYETWMTFYKLFTTDEINIFKELEDIPEEMKDLSRKFRLEIQKLVEEVVKQRNRELKFYQESVVSDIPKYEEMIEEAENETSREDMKNELSQLVEIREKIGMKMNEIQLGEIEIEEMDKEIVSRMEQLEESYKKGVLVLIEQSEESTFYRYQALLEEFQKTEECIKCEFELEEYNEKRKIISMKQEKFKEIQMRIEDLRKQKEQVMFEKGSCSKCERENQNLRFCKDCAKSGYSNTLKMGPNGKWIVLRSTTGILISCEDCSVAECQNHEFISIRDVDNLKDVTEWTKISGYFPSFKDEYIIDYFGKSVKEMVSIENKWKELKESKGCECFRRVIRLELKESILKCLNLKKREMLFYKDRLNTFLNLYETKLAGIEESEAKCRLQNTIYKLKEIQDKLSDGTKNWLSSEEVDLIDLEIEGKMLKLENEYRLKSFIQVEQVDGYFKYRSLIEELKAADDEQKEAKKKWEETRKEVEDYKKEHQHNFEDLKNAMTSLEKHKSSIPEKEFENRIEYVEQYHEILRQDQWAEQMKVDKRVIECNRAFSRKCFAELMILNYFPIPVDSEILNYFELIREFKNDNNLAPNLV